MTVQSWVRGPLAFTVAKATKTFEYKAEKLTSTSTPQRNTIRFFRGSSEKRYEKATHINQTDSQASCSCDLQTFIDPSLKENLKGFPKC